MKYFVFGLFLLIPFCFPISGYAQFSDDFSDGNFNQNPAWIGISDSFQVSSGQLRTTTGNASAAVLYLSSATNQNFTSWEFFFRMAFNPSSQNFMEFWLTADNLNLADAQNGYFVRLGGNTGDGIGLFKMLGGTISEIIPQSNNLVNGSSNNQGTIKVTRSESGNWEIFEKITGSNFVSFGSGTDNALSSSAGLGILIRSTKTNRSRHYFDDIKADLPAGPDLTPPNLLSADLISPNQADLNFSEPVDESFASQLNLYNISPALSISSAARAAGNFSVVRLTLASDVSPGTYTIAVSQSKDLAGNIQSNPQQALLTVTAAAGPRTLVINEILADPDPPVDLPAGEFAEFFNPGSVAVSIKDWTFSDATSSITLPNVSIPGGGFLILCNRADTIAYKAFGPTLGVTLPSLNNTGDLLTLKDNNGNVIDVIDYKTSWYGSTQKQNGGYTLEQINPFLVCSSKSNWLASNSVMGGTPGSANSILNNTPDATGPLFTDYVLSDSNAIRLSFSEPLNAQTPGISPFEITGNIQLVNVLNRFPQPENITLVFNKAFTTGETYRLKFSQIKDCAGNPGLESRFSFGKGKAPGRFDLLITEVQADDTPENSLPAAEYIEIFNAGASLIDLNGVQISDGSSTARMPAYALAPGEFLVLTGTSGAEKFSSIPDIRVLGLTSFPTLNTEGDNLNLLAANGAWIHQFKFRSNAFSPYSQWLDGWSLEMIDTGNPCDAFSNWAISLSPNGGTPGKENSVKASKPDQNTPVFERALVLSPDSIRLEFDELIDSLALASANLSIDKGYQITGRKISNRDFAAMKIGVSPVLKFDDLVTINLGPVRDCAGNQSQVQTAETARPADSDAATWCLNEILFDPKTGGTDYIELKNVSAGFRDLKDLRIANDAEEKVITDLNYPVPPGGIVLLTGASGLTLRDYPKGKSEHFLEMTLPSFNADSGTVRLLGPKGEVWQKFFYSEKFHARILDETKGVSLERISAQLPVNDPNSWQSASSDAGFGTPGYENSQSRNPSPGADFSADPATFSPNGDGNKDFTLFSYSTEKTGLTGNLRIFSAEGDLVKNVAESANLGAKGVWKWDGVNEQGRKCRIGLYLAVFEVTELGSGTRIFKVPVAIAAER